MITLPITEQTKQQDWNFILTMAKIYGYSQSEKETNAQNIRNVSYIHTNTTKETKGHPHLPQSTYT
jgi:predicted transcriptional regulator